MSEFLNWLVSLLPMLTKILSGRAGKEIVKETKDQMVKSSDAEMAAEFPNEKK